MGAVLDLMQSVLILFLMIMLTLTIRRVGRLGRVGPPEVRYISMPEFDPKPICGCEHHQCFHDENGCGKQAQMYNGRNGQYEIVPCGCKRYTGPEALPTVLP